MKANELMTGDWVKLKNNHCKSIQLTAIDETYNSINYFDGDAEGELTLQLTAIEPIPLTPEILEKNGFKKGIGFGYSETYPTYCWGYHNDVTDFASIEVTFYDKPIGCVKVLVRMETNSFNPWGFNRCHSCDIESIHELQHALRLCGIEKEIVL